MEPHSIGRDEESKSYYRMMGVNELNRLKQSLRSGNAHQQEPVDKICERCRKLIANMQMLAQRSNDEVYDQEALEFQNQLEKTMMNFNKGFADKEAKISYVEHEEVHIGDFVEPQEQQMVYMDEPSQEELDRIARDDAAQAAALQHENEVKAKELFREIWDDERQNLNIIENLIKKADNTVVLANNCLEIAQAQEAQIKSIAGEVDELGTGVKRLRKEVNSFLRASRRMKCCLVFIVLLAFFVVVTLIGVFMFPYISEWSQNLVKEAQKTFDSEE